MDKCGVEVLAFKVNEECTNATMTSVLDDVESRFGNKARLAQFIFYYAGHGIKDDAGRGWLALHGYNENNASTRFKMLSLKNKSIDIAATQQMYVLDCCHAGELLQRQRAKARPFEMHLASQPCVYGITAVTGDQEAIESGGNGLFTKTLCRAIGQKEAMTGTDIKSFVGERVFEASSGTMQPLGANILLDHFHTACNGEFVMFHNK